MAFRNIIIESPAHISVSNHRLTVRTTAQHNVPLEDISALLLESRQSTITTAALSLLGQRGCAVFVCDEQHMPCAVLTPFQQHSRSLSVLRSQLDATEPRKKHQARLKRCLPDNGSVRLLVITEKQYESIEILLGNLTEADADFQTEQLSIF